MAANSGWAGLSPGTAPPPLGLVLPDHTPNQQHHRSEQFANIDRIAIDRQTTVSNPPSFHDNTHDHPTIDPHKITSNDERNFVSFPAPAR